VKGALPYHRLWRKDFVSILAHTLPAKLTSSPIEKSRESIGMRYLLELMFVSVLSLGRSSIVLRGLKHTLGVSLMTRSLSGNTLSFYTRPYNH